MSMIKRNQTSDDTLSDNLHVPIDLVSDILSRLHVKALLRFKSVCKRWSALIENPTFIKRHLTVSRLNPNPALTSIFVNGFVQETSRYSMWLLFRDKTNNLNRNFLFPNFFHVLGICDGLVCAYFKKVITIYNPSIRQVRKISGPLGTNFSNEICFFGFIFKDNDYKLFKINVYVPSAEVIIRAEVYAMSTDIWRKIDVKTGAMNPYPEVLYLRSCGSPPVALNDFFYWETNASCVACFDMNEYVFSVIACPMGIKSWNPNNPWKLVELTGELALTTCSGTEWFELWVLNEKEKSWKKKLRVRNLPSIGRYLKTIGCEKSGKLVMQHHSPEGHGIKLFSYDPESYAITDLPFNGLMDYQYVYLYTESLISPGHRKDQIKWS